MAGELMIMTDVGDIPAFTRNQLADIFFNFC